MFTGSPGDITIMSALSFVAVSFSGVAVGDVWYLRVFPGEVVMKAVMVFHHLA
jgi:hypothetical protein